jgi:hypothetical protein
MMHRHCLMLYHELRQYESANSTHNIFPTHHGAFATLNHEAPALFDAIARATQVRINEFNMQALATTAWSFAVFDMESCSFTHLDSPFAQKLRSIDPSIFHVKDLRQRHQFQLWCKEQNGATSWYPDDFSQRCREAFVSNEPEPSRLQNVVVEAIRKTSRCKWRRGGSFNQERLQLGCCSHVSR